MKKFIPKLLLLSGVAIALAACSKKDSAKSSGDLVGKWSVVSDTTRLYDNNNKLVETDVNTDIKPTDYVQFNENLTGSEQEYGFHVTFTYKLNGSTLSLVYTGSNVPGAIADPIQDVTIKHLDAHTLSTLQVTPDTVDINTIYQSKESIHFSK